MKSKKQHSVWLRVAVLALIAGQLLMPMRAMALGTTNITASGTVGTVINTSGATHTITGGTVASTNLFHSFGRFDLESGHTADFKYGTGTTNIISRVTDGFASNIYGFLKVSASGAAGTPAFWFINPAGINIGTGGKTNGPGAFHFSTANYLKSGTDVFYADTTSPSTFFAAAPTAFGFLGTTRASITVGGGEIVEANSGRSTLSMVAGDVALGDASGSGGLQNYPGDIRVVAMGATAGEIPVTGTPSDPTWTARPSGDVTISSGSRIRTLSLDGRDAGSIFIAGGDFAISGNSGSTGITTQTSSTGKAGDINVAVNSLTMTNRATFTSTVGVSASGDGGVANFTVRDTMTVCGTCSIKLETNGAGNAGNINLKAGALSIQQSPSLLSGAVDTVRTAAVQSLARKGTGNAGDVLVEAGTLTLAKYGIISSDTITSGNGGKVIVKAGTLSMGDTSYISARTLKSGAGGELKVVVDGALTNDRGQITAITYGDGSGGAVSVTANSIQLIGGTIESGAFGNKGRSGTVNVIADSLSLSGGRVGTGSLAEVGKIPTGDAGSVIVAVKSLTLDNGSIESSTEGLGRGGTVSVTVANGTGTALMTVRNSGNVSSTTSLKSAGAGAAGQVTVTADNLTIDGTGQTAGTTGLFSSTSGTGTAGGVQAVVTSGTGAMVVQGGGTVSSSSTSASTSAATAGGNAGTVAVSAKSLTVNNGSIVSDTLGMGQAGTVGVTVAGNMNVTSAGKVSSSTSGAGSGGTVTVRGANVTVDGTGSSINASAATGSSGKTGAVTVTASDTVNILNAGEVAIRNDATVSDPSLIAPTTLTVSGANITMLHDAQLTSQSTGNVKASDIAVSVTNKLWLDPTGITASAFNGNGGSITIEGGKTFILDRSVISTSVTGSSGNAGNISIAGKTLIMSNGFIQANTSAALASGGTINLNVDTLIASNNNLLLGGSTPYAFSLRPGFNVIQAASPTGVSGTVTLSTPSVDVAGSLVVLKPGALPNGNFSRNPCAASGGSSFAQAGRGGLPTSSFGLIRAEGAKATSAPAIAIDSMDASMTLTVASARMGCSAG